MYSISNKSFFLLNSPQKTQTSSHPFALPVLSLPIPKIQRIEWCYWSVYNIFRQTKKQQILTLSNQSSKSNRNVLLSSSSTNAVSKIINPRICREQKNWNSEKQDQGKLIHLTFVDLEHQQEVQQALIEIKIQLHQTSKTKLIFYSSEYHLVETLHKARTYGIDLSQIPSALYSPDLHQDLTQHLGWREPLLGNLSVKSSIEFQENVKKWITSPGQRIDMWTAHLTVDSQEGNIFRLDPTTNTFSLIYEKDIEEHFISHLSIGHHSQLAANYESNRKEYSHQMINKCIFNLQSLKKFCCIGNPSLQASTGIVDIIFKDEKGHTQQITKHLAKEGNKRGVLTLLFSNIDKFMGMKLNGGRLNDGKLEMGVFQSSNEFRFVGSSNGEILVRMKAAQIFMSIGSICLKLVNPRELRISHWGKTKVLISKDTLEC